jgi:hypothetical protein
LRKVIQILKSISAYNLKDVPLRNYVGLKGNEVSKLCVSNQFVEQQAYEFSEKIRGSTLYKFVGTVITEDNLIDGNVQKGNELAMVTKVILQDEDGNLYYVAPNPNGLRFAKKEITFKEYKEKQKNETRNAIATFLGIIVFFGLVMVTMVQFLV